MARLFIDGFERNDLALWDNIVWGAFNNSGVKPGTLTAAGSYWFWVNVYGANVTKLVSPANPDTLFMKTYYLTSNVTVVKEVMWVSNGAGLQLAVCMETDGRLSVRKNNRSGTQLAVGNTPLVSNAPYLIEARFVIGQNGIAQVKIGGVLDIDFAGDTRNQASNTITSASVGTSANTSGATNYYDHVVIDDAEWIGDGDVLLLVPNGAGTYSDLTPSAGVNYQCVDEFPPSDSDYVSSNTPEVKDSYVKAALPTAFQIKCVQLTFRAVGQGAPAVTGLKSLWRIGAVDYLGAKNIVRIGGYTDISEMFQNNPATGARFTSGELNGAEMGFQLVA